MPEDEPVNMEGLVWEIGKYLVIFRYRAEVEWLDTDPDLDDRSQLQGLESAFHELTGRLRRCAEIKPQGKFHAFAEAVNIFWSKYRIEWQGSRRSKKISSMGIVDSDHQREGERRMFEGSPLQNGDWEKVKSALHITLQALASDALLKACIELSMLLLSDIYPTFTNGERAVSYVLNTENLRRKARQQMQTLVESFSFLAGLNLAFIDARPMEIIKTICSFVEQIETPLLNPEERRGYLGLIMHQYKQQVCRNGKSITLGGKQQWEILRLLEKNRDNPSNVEVLGRAWGTGQLDQPRPNALHRAISDLRKALAPLSISIKPTRNLGWTLVELPAALAD